MAPTRRSKPTQKIQRAGSKNKIARVVFTIEQQVRPTLEGIVLVCGQGDMGQLGLGDEVNMMERTRPAHLTSVKNAVQVVAGGMHSLVLTAEGNIYTFGCNDEGALGRDTAEEGSEFVPKIVELPGLAVKVSAGDSHSACLLEDGQVLAWGSFRDSHGNMGLTLEGNKKTAVNLLPNEICADIASGSDHLVILTVQGRVYTVGCGEQGQLGRVGSRSASGESRRGKTELLRPGLLPIKRNRRTKEIWASNYCTFCRDETDKIWGFGLNNYKQLLYEKDVNIVLSPIDTGLEEVKAIAGGQHHTMVLKENGQCFSVGRRDYGRLGLGKPKADVLKLTLIDLLKKENIAKIFCGEVQSFALTNNGQLFVWGMGSNHQLGMGHDDDVWCPEHLESKQMIGKIITDVSSGGQHSIFLAVDKKPEVSSSSSTASVQLMNGKEKRRKLV